MSAQKQKKESRINLLSPDRFDTTVRGRVLNWALSSFRVIVIITELVVIVAFFSRFWLDSKNSDLDDIIQQKHVAIVASSEFENEYKNVQKRLEILSEILDRQGATSQVFQMLIATIPSDIILESVSINKDESSISVSGASPSEKSIQQYTANLLSSNIVNGVSLSEIKVDQKNQSSIAFELSVETTKNYE